MTVNNVLAIIVVTIVANLAIQAQSPVITLGEFANLLMSGLMELPGSIIGLGYNTVGVVGAKFMDSVGCQIAEGEDADACRNISQIIRSRGFEVEEYEVTTGDGYVLGVQRLINPLVDPAYRPKLRPVLLQHGVFSTADNWVLISLNVRPTPWPPAQPQTQQQQIPLDKASGTPEEDDDDSRHPRSLAFYLANQGYDVWLGNFRGNFYSLKHVELSVVDPEFWDFSLDEQVDFDLPDTIRFIQSTTGYQKIGYVGWSQGATIMFALQADHPEYADIIEPFISLGPVTYLHNTKTPATAFLPLIPVAQGLNLGFSFSDLLRFVMQKICGSTMVQKLTCVNLAGEVYGHDQEGFDTHRLGTYLHHFPAGSSFKDIAHFAQLIMSQKFARYNWGVLGNMEKYGTLLPPDYDLANIRSKSMVFFTGVNDFLADPEDVQLLVTTMSAKPMKWFNMAEEIPKWNHMDYIYHKLAGKLVNRRIIEVLEEFRSRDSEQDVRVQTPDSAQASVPIQDQEPVLSSIPIQTQFPVKTEIPDQASIPDHAQVPIQTATPVQASVPYQAPVPIHTPISTFDGGQLQAAPIVR